MTVVHEFGHSFQEYKSAQKHKIVFDIIPSADISEMRKKYLPFDYDEFEDLIHQGAEFFMFDSFITFPKYVFCYVPAYINAIELVFHKDGRYDKYLDMCNHLGHRTYEETLEAVGLHHAFDEEAIGEAAETLRNIILREHNNMQVK